MINVDTSFAKKEEYDYASTIAGINTSVASVNTRTVVEGTKIPSVMPTIYIGDEFRIDAKPFINRPFFVEEVAWADTARRYTFLSTTYYKLPRDIIRSNTTLLEGMKIGSLYRSSCELNVSVAGTITHAGCILVGIVPPFDVDLPNDTTDRSTFINTILSGPHGFLHANEATSLTLHVPWYCNTDLDSLDFTLPSATYRNPVTLDNYAGNMATLVMLVLNPLQPSTGSSTSLSIVVEASFRNLDILVPTPRYVTYVPQSYFTNLGTSAFDGAARFAKKITGDGIDVARSWVRSFTGLHNPNTPQINQASLLISRNRLNNVDTMTFLENLDPYANDVRVVQEPIFNTTVDEMSINHIIGKRQFIGTFLVNATDAVGLRLFNRPISPWQGGLSVAVGATDPATVSNNIELMHLLSRAWKGDIKITIQSVMNNKQQIKLRLLQLYNPSIYVSSSYPEYRSILQAPSHLMEFTAGGQEQSVVMPYLSRNRLTPCSRDSSTEALMHGEYYIYVAQPLANSSGSPTSIYFNVYITLPESFNFYGYSTEIMRANAAITIPTPARQFEPETLEVMNEPQQQDNSMSEIGPATDTRLQPIIDIRPLIRRLYPSLSFSFPLSALAPFTFSFPLRDLIGEGSAAVALDLQTPTNAISRMYYGKHPGFKIRFTTFATVPGTGLPRLDCKIYYAPPAVVASLNNPTSATLTASIPHSSSLGYNNGSLTAQFPLNNVSIPTLSTDRTVYEFSVPNSNIYKFVGSPDKCNTINPGVPPSSSSDAGSLVFSFLYPVAITVNCLIEAACSDETRFGFHSMAPLITRSGTAGLLNTPGFGSLADYQALPTAAPNKYLYYTRV
jgi:hypothetical protein